MSVAKVVSLTEGPFDVVKRFISKTSTISLSGIRGFSQTIRTATRAFLHRLDGATVPDIPAHCGQLLFPILAVQEGTILPKRISA